MSWKKPFPEPIRLKGNREIKTLSEAGTFILGLSERIQGSPTVSYATELLLIAAKSGKAEHIKDAADQVHRALKANGFIGR